MIRKYAQRRIYDAINRPPVYCFIAVSFVTFLLGFASNMAIHKWQAGSKSCHSNSNSESYIGKTRNVDLSRYISREPIDVVYTWVNGSDSQFLQDVEKYLLLEANGKRTEPAVCKLEQCILFGALLFDEVLPQQFTDCLKEKDNGIVADEDSEDKVFVAFPKIKNETQCSFANKKTGKPGCITSSENHTPSASHPLAFYLTGASKLGPFKDEKSLRDQLPASIANHITDIKVDIDADFAILLFQNENQKEDAEKELGIYFSVRTEYPLIASAFIVDCEEFMATNALRLEARPKRFIDNEELRFSLRSLDLYAPWVRHVYLVTNGQIPSWLNLDNPHLTLVTHGDIFGERSEHVLPTFSSPAIESQLINIPNIGEAFLYFNDDFFLSQQVFPEDFITLSQGRKFYLTYSLPNCAPGCPHTWIKDGFCDRTCNNSDCDFDGGDCQIASNVTQPIPVNPLDLEFALERAYCSSGCSNAWIADNFCDSFCNVPACAFDAGDCGLAALLNPHYGFFTFTVVPNYSETVVVNVPEQQFVAIGNLSAVVPHGKQFKIGKCSTEITPGLRTSSFVPSHSLFILIAYRNISNAKFTAECELTFADSNLIKFAISFDTSVNLAVQQTSSSSVPEKPRLLPKITPFKEVRSYFDRFPRNKRHYKIVICARFIPFVRRSIFLFKNKELTRLGLGFFLESLLLPNNSICPRKFLTVFEVDTEETEKVLATTTTLKPTVSSNRIQAKVPKSGTRRKVPGLHKKQQSSSIILSRFKPKSPNLSNANSSANQEQMPPDAFSGSLAYVNKILNKDFGYAQRRMPAHAPLLVERKIFKELYERYQEEWLATSSRRFRSYDDMQFQFSYMYYIMSTTMADSADSDRVVERIFEEIDLDQSGDLSFGELRTLTARATGTSYSLQSWRLFVNSMVEHYCFNNLTDFLSIYSPDDQKSFSDDSDSRQQSVRKLTAEDAKKCFPLRRLFMSIAKLRPKYKFEALLADDDTAVFRMLGAPNSALLIESWLNLLRKRPPKFFCLNDDLDHSEPLKQETEHILSSVKQFLFEMYPRRSQFELPPNFRNVFQSVDQFRQYQAETLQHKTKAFYAFVLVTAAICLLFVCRWADVFQKIWRGWFRSKRHSLGCGLADD